MYIQCTKQGLERDTGNRILAIVGALQHMCLVLGVLLNHFVSETHLHLQSDYCNIRQRVTVYIKVKCTNLKRMGIMQDVSPLYTKYSNTE